MWKITRLKTVVSPVQVRPSPLHETDVAPPGPGDDCPRRTEARVEAWALGSRPWGPGPPRAYLQEAAEAIPDEDAGVALPCPFT